jgi:hypothetical protein
VWRGTSRPHEVAQWIRWPLAAPLRRAAPLSSPVPSKPVCTTPGHQSPLKRTKCRFRHEHGHSELPDVYTVLGLLPIFPKGLREHVFSVWSLPPCISWHMQPSQRTASQTVSHYSLSDCCRECSTVCAWERSYVEHPRNRPWRSIGLRDVDHPKLWRQSAHRSGEVMDLTRRQRFNPRIPSGTHFCYRLCEPQGHGADGWIW